MRKPVREVNVFSVSALDLFASALGAFIVMSMIFMVFFSMTARDSGEDESLQAALEQCEANRNQAEAALAQCQANLDASADASELAQCQSELSGARAQSADLRAQLEAAGGVTARLDEVNSELESCRRALKKTFVLVIASWSSTNDDVDLHVVDPQGREFYYGQKRHTGSNAALEEDNRRGPGNEIWLHPNAEPGRYRVCYKFFRDRRTEQGNSLPNVRGSVLWQEGKLEIGNVSLTQEREVKVAVEFTVDDEGMVSVDRSRSRRRLGGEDCR